MSTSEPETSLTAAEAERQRRSPPPAEPDSGSDLKAETAEQERRGYPDEPTTS
jgi:hypothetical protein